MLAWFVLISCLIGLVSLVSLTWLDVLVWFGLRICLTHPSGKYMKTPPDSINNIVILKDRPEISTSEAGVRPPHPGEKLLEAAQPDTVQGRGKVGEEIEG